VSSSLSGAATNAWEDILKPKVGRISEEKAATVNKILGEVDNVLHKLVRFLFF